MPFVDPSRTLNKKGSIPASIIHKKVFGPCLENEQINILPQLFC